MSSKYERISIRICLYVAFTEINRQYYFSTFVFDSNVTNISDLKHPVFKYPVWNVWLWNVRFEMSGLKLLVRYFVWNAQFEMSGSKCPVRNVFAKESREFRSARARCNWCWQRKSDKLSTTNGVVRRHLDKFPRQNIIQLSPLHYTQIDFWSRWILKLVHCSF